MLVLCALLAVVGASNDGFMRADAELGLVDSVGRQRFFRGVNVVVKRAPWLPSLSAAWDPFSSYNTRDMAQLQAWGFNIVRLGVMWPGVNPHSSNAVNATYLAEAARLVDAAAGYGIVTLLDLHQDLASPFFCGEGFPDYLVAPPGGLSSFPLPVSLPYKTNSSTGYPVSCPKSFGEYYATAAVAEAFQALYDNARGLADAFVGYWSAVSSFFASNTNVVGLELLNEPFAGDFFREPSLLEPGVTDLLYLTPLYARAIAAIRRNDAKHIIFFEPMVADVGPVGFDAAPDKNSVLSYHVYCSSQPSKADRKLCWGELEATFWMRQEDRRRMGVAAMQTEFGAVGDGEESIATLRQQVDMCEREGQSFIYWAFKYFGDPTTSGNSNEGFYFGNGTLQTAKVRALSRTYAQAVQGRLVSSSFNSDSGLFVCLFVANTSIGGSTQIFVSPFFYPGGFSVSVSPSDAVNVTVATPTVLLTALCNGTITVTISAK